MNQENIFAFTPADAGSRPPYVSLNECGSELVLTIRGYSGGGSVAPTDQVVVSIDDVHKMAAGLNAYLAHTQQPAAVPVTETGLPELRDLLKIAAVYGDPILLSSASAGALCHAMTTGQPAAVPAEQVQQ